jgi:hypothetical protein
MAEMIGDLLQGEPSMQEPAGTCVTQAMRAEPIQLQTFVARAPHFLERHIHTFMCSTT